jgi:Calcineurin-like phosphoesterase
MTDQHHDAILHDHNDDGVDRRGFLTCMAWAGTGALWLMNGGVLEGHSLGRLLGLRPKDLRADLSFVQISDSHMGFNKPANTDVVATFQTAIDRVNALPTAPAFMLHTGDVSHLSKPEEFDTVQQMLKAASVPEVFYVPGEHDVLEDDGKEYLKRFGKGTSGNGWNSFDKNGVHFIGLVNVMQLKAGGLGTLGAEQLEWLERDVKRLSASTPSDMQRLYGCPGPRSGNEARGAPRGQSLRGAAGASRGTAWSVAHGTAVARKVAMGGRGRDAPPHDRRRRRALAESIRRSGAGRARRSARDCALERKPGRRDQRRPPHGQAVVSGAAAVHVQLARPD